MVVKVTQKQVENGYVMAYELWVVATIDCRPSTQAGRVFREEMVREFRATVVELRRICKGFVKSTE